MKCSEEFKDVKYNTDLFCKTCGMDIGLNPLIIKDKKNVYMYCCEGCSKIK